MKVKDFKYIKNVINGGVGIIDLKEPIGTIVDDKGNLIYGISGSAFSREMQYLQEQCTLIKVHINSVGGSVLDAFSIYSAILNSKVPVHTYIDGLAASSAAVIAVAGQKCFMADYGMMMIHSVSGGDDDEVTTMFENSIVTMLSTRCKMKSEEVAAMMKKETWMKPAEALKMGFVDEITPSDKKVNVSIKKTKNLFELANHFNTHLNKPNMKNTAKLLNIVEESNDETFAAKVTELQNALKKAETERDELKAKNDELNKEKVEKEEAAKTDLTNRATTLVNKAVVDKKTTADEASNLIEIASQSEKGFTTVSNLLNGVSTVKNAVHRVDTDLKNANDEVKKKTDARKDWTILDWQQKDPDGLENMLENDKASYDNLYNAYYKK